MNHHPGLNFDKGSASILCILPATLGLMFNGPAFAESSSSHRIGFVTSAETNDQRTELAAASGAGWIRADLIWPVIEPAKGVFNWGAIDALVAHAQAAGVKIYANAEPP